MKGLPADKVARVVGMLEAGARVSVTDERKGDDKVIAEGIIRDISFQEEAAYIYLNTGYYVVILPAIHSECAH